MNISIKLSKCSRISTNSLIRCLYHIEPPYLDDNKSDVPSHPPLNVQIKGYDFTILEKYGKWIHNIADHMGFQISDCWATPGQKMHIKTYKPYSSVIDSTFDLQIYERNVQVSELSSISIAPLIEVISAGIPEGVELSLHEHMKEYEDILYIPDLELKDLKHQLEESIIPT